MYDLLTQMRVVEGSSFVASPSCGLYLAQMGAEVIRFDSIGGGPDYRRWPLDPASGDSFYWEGLNKGKKSIALDLGRPEGRDIAIRLITAPGDAGGLFVTNFPVNGFLAHERLAAHRSDLISVRVMGNADGSSALDYTANSAVGVPFLTGPAKLADEPVNNVLPTWDLLTGAYTAFAVLAAARKRQQTGEGGEVRIPLSDVAIATVGNLGQIAEVLATGADRPRLGNDVFGAFGRDFTTADGRRLMILAITPKQWRGLLEALQIEQEVAAVEAGQGVSFASDEGMRFHHRDALFPIVAGAVKARRYEDLRQAFERCEVCWGPYQTTSEAACDAKLVTDNPIFSQIQQPSGRTYPTPGAMATLPGRLRRPAVRAPRLGEHTEEILADVLGMSAGEITRLHDAGLVASPR